LMGMFRNWEGMNMTSTEIVEGSGLALRILTRQELVARLQACTIGTALELLAHDALLQKRIKELEGACAALMAIWFGA
jgi:hypothetical protein